MQNLQISNCRNNKVKKHILTLEYGKFNSSILNHSTMVIITFHAVLLLTMNCAILTIFFYTSLHGLILPCNFSLCIVVDLIDVRNFSIRWRAGTDQIIKTNDGFRWWNHTDTKKYEDNTGPKEPSPYNPSSALVDGYLPSVVALPAPPTVPVRTDSSVPAQGTDPRYPPLQSPQPQTQGECFILR